ncbi:hypothetical protein SK128_011571, partial [Halocaridina rubra]
REIVQQRTVTHEVRTTKTPLSAPVSSPPPSALLEQKAQTSASSATKELDDLMASLSDFKVKEEIPVPSGAVVGATAAPPKAMPLEAEGQKIQVVRVINHYDPPAQRSQAATAVPASATISVGSSEGAGGPAGVRNMMTFGQL